VVRFPVGTSNFSLSQSLHIGYGLPQPYINGLSSSLSPEVMRPGREADKSPPLSVGDPTRTAFMNYTDLCPGVPQTSVGNSHGVSQVIKKYISEHVCEHFDFPTVVERGTAVAQWLRCCAKNRKFAGSIPNDVIGIFH